MHDEKTITSDLSKGIFFAKGIAISLVVIGHFVSHTTADQWEYLRISLNVPTFFLTAGLLYAYKERSITLTDYFQNLSKRAMRLMLPYLVMSVIMLAIKFSAGYLGDLKHPVGDDWYWKIFVNPMGGFAPYLWFIYVLFEIVVLFPLVRYAVRNDTVLLIIMVFLSVLPFPDLFQLDLLFIGMLIFYIGYLGYNRGWFNSYGYKKMLFLILVYLLFAFLYPAIENYLILRAATEAVLATLGPSIILLLCIPIAKYASKYVGIFIQFGIYSYGIYLFHTIPMGIIEAIMHRLPSFGYYSVFIPSVLSGILLPVILEKIIANKTYVTNKLLFGK